MKIKIINETLKKMHKLKTLILFTAVVAVGTLYSCGGGDSNDDPKTEKELTIEALSGTWNLDASSSQFANTGIDGSGISVTISQTGFTLTGNITDYVSEGTFTIAEDGTLANPAVTIASSEVELDGTVSISLNSAKDSITVSFATKAADARISGLGAFVLVFKKAS